MIGRALHAHGTDADAGSRQQLEQQQAAKWAVRYDRPGVRGESECSLGVGMAEEQQSWHELMPTVMVGSMLGGVTCTVVSAVHPSVC